MKKISIIFSIVFTFLLSNSFAQDAAYTMTATTKTITSCRSTLDMELGCASAGKSVYCANLDRAYTFVSSSGTILNANLTFHILDDDFIYVYDGPSTASPLIATWTGGSTTNCFNGLNATSTGTTITIRFVSNGTKGITYSGTAGTYYSGWSILIGCAPTTCNGNTPANDNCVSAPQICNLNGYCGNTSGWYNEDNPQLEGQAAPGFGGSIENNSWINFVAGATTTTLVVNSANCLFSGSGIQGAVYKSTDCSTFTPVTGGNFNQSTAAGTVTLSLTGLVAGQDYYLMLDGYGGNICDYTVTALGNVQTLQTTASATSNTICPNQSFTVTATSGATSYSWNPAPASTSSNTAVYNNISSTSVISTTAFGYCGASATVALTMSVVSLPVTAASSTICSGNTATLTATGATNYTWSTGATTSSVSVSPSSSTVYSFTGTANGCTNTNTVSVSVTANPTVAVTNTTICNGSSVTLTASGATTYSWNTGATTNTISVTPTTTTVYTVTGTSSNCTNTQTVSVSVTSNPTVAVASTTVCNGTPVTLTASGATTYSWNTGATTNTISVTPTTTTVYTVTGTTSSCVNTKTVSVTVNSIPVTTASTSGTLTCTTNSVTLNSTLAGVSYTWVAPAGGSVSSANTQSTSASGAAGIYTLNVQNAAGCTYSTTTSVTQNTVVPTGVSAGSNQTLGCGSSSVVTLSGSATTPTNATASWGGPSISGSTTNFSTTANGAGTYTLTATNPANGCTATSTVLVNPSAGSPAVTINPVTNTITCTNTLVTVGISSTVSPATYTWSGSGIVSGNGTGTITVSQGGSYNFTLTNTTNSCSASGSTVVVTNTSAPTTTASTSGSLTCSPSSSTVGLSSSLSGMNYTWTAPSGGSVANANSQNTSATGAAGVYTLNVVNPTTGCTFSTTTSVSQNITAPVTTASTTGTITCTTSTVSLSSTLAGMNYTWTAPSGGSVTNPNAQNTSATGVGTYTLNVENPSNSCTYTTTSTVTNNTIVPTGVSAGSNQTLTCTSGSITLTGSVSTPTNAGLDWGTNVCGSQTTATTTACAAGVYTLTATDLSNGCTATSTVEVFPNAGAPSPTISATALSIDCNNATQSVTVTSTPSTNIVYNWDNTPFSASSDSSIVTFNNAGTYICTVTNTVSNCSTPVQVVVTNNTTLPTINITGTQTLTCASPSVSISVTTTPTSGLTYTWTGAAVVSGQGTNSVGVNQSGVYTVSVTNTSNGCVNTATTQVDADANVPVANITATSTNSMITCSSPSVTLSAGVTPAGTYSYSWSPVIGSSTSITVGTAGVYTVLVTNSTSGCSVTAQYTVGSNTTPPTVSSSNAVIPCGSPSITLTSSATNVTYSWTTTSGSILSGSNTASPVVGSAGVYVLTVVDNTNGCSNTTTVNVTSTAVVAAFDANPTSGTAPLSVNFTNNSTGATSYSWTFGDTNNNTSSSTDPSHTYTTNGTYVVTLVASDALGLCSSTATISIEVFENSSIIVPNVFTPNGDKSNDTFKFKTVGIKDLTCDIFNRWGQKLYTIKDVTDSWDGGSAPDGTYFFIMKATGFDGKDYTQQGYISLFK